MIGQPLHCGVRMVIDHFEHEIGRSATSEIVWRCPHCGLKGYAWQFNPMTAAIDRLLALPMCRTAA